MSHSLYSSDIIAAPLVQDQTISSHPFSSPSTSRTISHVVHHPRLLQNYSNRQRERLNCNFPRPLEGKKCALCIASKWLKFVISSSVWRGELLLVAALPLSFNCNRRSRWLTIFCINFLLDRPVSFSPPSSVLSQRFGSYSTIAIQLVIPR